jgi:hypothetical protein
MLIRLFICFVIVSIFSACKKKDIEEVVPVSTESQVYYLNINDKRETLFHASTNSNIFHIKDTIYFITAEKTIMFGNESRIPISMNTFDSDSLFVKQNNLTLFKGKFFNDSLNINEPVELKIVKSNGVVINKVLIIKAVTFEHEVDVKFDSVCFDSLNVYKNQEMNFKSIFIYNSQGYYNAEFHDQFSEYDSLDIYSLFATNLNSFHYKFNFLDVINFKFSGIKKDNSNIVGEYTCAVNLELINAWEYINQKNQISILYWNNNGWVSSYYQKTGTPQKNLIKGKVIVTQYNPTFKTISGTYEFEYTGNYLRKNSSFAKVKITKGVFSNVNIAKFLWE